MNSRIAEDFYDALVVMQDIEADHNSESAGEDATNVLAEQVFAFLDNCTADYDDDFALLEQLAA